MPKLADIETWDEFVEGLRIYDRYYRYHGEYGFDVLGETHSWLHTIRIGSEVSQLSDWTRLAQRECNILRGKKHEDEGCWGLLGSLRAGAPYVFNNANMREVGPIRTQIREQIKRVLNAGSNDISVVAHDAMKTIAGMRHKENARNSIGPAAATRWLTLARPEFLVSVNNESVPGLRQALGFRQNSQALWKDYSTLLAKLHEKPWFNEFNGRQPDDPLERDIWNCRAALVDVFVYKHDLNHGTNLESHFYILNTNFNDAPVDHNDMITHKKAAAYFDRKSNIEGLQKGDIVFLYQSGVGIVATGKASGRLEKVPYQGDAKYADEEYFMSLKAFQRIDSPLSASEIKMITRKKYCFRPTMISVDNERGELLRKHVNNRSAS